jgi:dTDP-4-amino-4,6-dideoxygalactose transaminase
MLESAFGGGTVDDFRNFEAALSDYYKGAATLTYKGREALELAMRISGLPKGSLVGINGFTCYVVYRAVQRAGYTPVFLDVAPGQMHFGIDELKNAHAEHTKLRAIIVQNTLGYPADLPALRQYCEKHKLLIVEDVAHSLGAVYADGQEVGTVGELAMFSFSQDKPLDVVAGGAFIDRRQDVQNKSQPVPKRVSWWQREINRDYPLWTGLIRASYPSGFGRLLHFVLKKLHCLARPMQDAGPGLHRMSTKTAHLALTKWSDRQAELQHRRQIAAVYEQHLPKALQLIPKPSGKPSYLRFPLVVDSRPSLIRYLKKQRIYIGDTWYDAPIAPKRYLSQTDYKPGMCPRAEELAERIVNLPTHINISPEQAAYIAGKVKQWHALQ